MESVLDTRNSSFECGLVTNILARGCECFSFYFNIFTKNGDESIFFTIFPRYKFIDMPNINFIVKVILHFITAYCLMFIVVLID
jgi:hypothetical protein